MTADATHLRACAWLERVCLGFTALGVALPIAWRTPAFALYRDALATAIHDRALVASSTAQLVAGITGGSIAGKWALHWAVARYGVRARRRWAWGATLAGLLTWLVVDSASSLACGAWANVVMVNALPPLLVLPLAWRLRAACDREPTPPEPAARRIAGVATGTALFGVVTGLVIAFGMTTVVFDAWWAGLSVAHFGGHPLPAAARALVRFFAGPIGGSTAGHCVMLALVARRAVAAREPWAWRWSAISVLVWALTDSAWSLLAGGAFNVWLVNAPCATVLLTPLAWAWWSDRRATAAP